MLYVYIDSEMDVVVCIDSEMDVVCIDSEMDVVCIDSEMDVVVCI